VIQDFKDVYRGEKCVIIGNGPSLNGMDLEGIKFDTFGANKIYTFPYAPTFYTCIDSDMLHDCAPWLISHPEYAPKGIFLPNYLPFPGATPLNVVVNAPFSIDVSRFITMGGTVTFANMQLAYYMGFETVYLIGCDHRYVKAEKGGVPGSKFIASGKDPDHFGDNYFEEGKFYNRPELDAVKNNVYPLANEVFNRTGRKIINLTPNSAIECFERGNIDVLYN